MKNKSKINLNIIGIICIIIGLTIICFCFILLRNNDSFPSNKHIKGEKVSESTINQLVKIANLDTSSYPLFPFKKEGKINDYSDEEKDYVIAYYAKRMGWAIKGKNQNIDICSSIECYVIEEENYKNILKTYEIEDYDSFNIYNKDNLYYFIFDAPYVSEGKVTHDISATYGDDEVIILIDDITYSLFDLDKTKIKLIYTFKTLENNEYSLSSIEKKQ